MVNDDMFNDNVGSRRISEGIALSNTAGIFFFETSKTAMGSRRFELLTSAV
jgi:hypothetical protein